MIKVLITAVIIALISFISQRNTLLGAILASIPLTSLLAILWLYRDTHDINKIINLSHDIFWLVVPSLAFFLIFPNMLKHKVSFPLSVTVSVSVVVTLYYFTVLLMKRFGA